MREHNEGAPAMTASDQRAELKPSDRAIAQAFFEVMLPGDHRYDTLTEFIRRVVQRARTLDAAPSEPSAECWRRAIVEICAPGQYEDHVERVMTAAQRHIEQRAREIAREGK